MDAAIRRGGASVSGVAGSPAPVRGELVRRIGNAFREQQEDLATLVTWEAGKILPEARGEVQEMIDICDFAVGLSRQLYGKTIASERPGHRLTEYWHPLGPGRRDLGVQFSGRRVGLERDDRPGVRRPDRVEAVGKDAALRDRLPAARADAPCSKCRCRRRHLQRGDRRRARSARRWPRRHSCRSSRPPAACRWAARSPKRSPPGWAASLLELGGNNGMIVAPSADLELAVRSIVFAAVGTCGQRCTTLRRLIVHESIADELRDRMLAVYKQLADRRSHAKRRARRAARSTSARSTRWKPPLPPRESKAAKSTAAAA